MPFIDVARQRRQQITCVVGMALMWPSLHNLLCYPLTYSVNQAGNPHIYGFFLLYGATMLVVAGALWSMREAGWRRIFGSTTALCVLGAAGMLGIMLIISSGMENMPAAEPMAVGAVLAAIYVPVHFSFWSIQLLNASEKRVAFDLLCSYILFSVVSGLRIALHIQSAPLALALPALSSALACYALGFPQKKHPISPSRLAEDFPLSYLVTATALIYAGSFSMWLLNSEYAMVAYPSWERAAMHLALAIIMGATALAYRPKARIRKHAFIIMAVLFSTMLGAAMMLSALTAEFGFDLGNYPTIAGVNAMQVGIWLLVLVHAQVKRLGIVRAASAYLVLVVEAGQFANATLLYLVQQGIIDRANFPVLAISAILACVVLLAVNISLAVALSRKAATESNQPEKAPCMATINAVLDDEKVLERMRDSFKLSKRETDTLRLAMSGTSAREMAAQLFVAESTVNSHLKSIYRKTDVHSKKDLVKLVDRYRHGETSEVK